MEDALFGDEQPAQTTEVEVEVDVAAEPVAQNGTLEVEDVEESGAKLPEPSQMGPEESILLREWRRKKAIELEEKARLSRERHDQVIADAKMELEAFYHKREINVAQAKANNKEKEKAYVDNLLNMNSKQGANYWESVCAFINFEAPAKKEKPKSKNEPVRSSVLLQEAKPGKHTDLARMRQTLLKLKHNPPKSFTEAAKPAATPAPVAAKAS